VEVIIIDGEEERARRIFAKQKCSVITVVSLGIIYMNVGRLMQIGKERKMKKLIWCRKNCNQ